MLGAYLNAYISKLQVQTASFASAPAATWHDLERLKAQALLEKTQTMIVAFQETVATWKIHSSFRHEIINMLLWFSNHSKTFNPSYYWFANKLYCCTKTVQRTVDALCSLGLLYKRFTFKKTNTYRFNTVIYSPVFRELFMKTFTALAKLPILAGMSSGSRGVQQPFNNLYNNNTAVSIYTKGGLAAAQNTQSENKYKLHECTASLKTAEWRITLEGRIKLQVFNPEFITKAVTSEAFLAHPRWTTLITLCKEEHWLHHIPVQYALEQQFFNHYNTHAKKPYIQFFKDTPAVQETIRARITCEQCQSSLHTTQNHVATYGPKPIERTPIIATPSKRHEIVFTSLLDEMNRLRKENAAKGKS